MAKDIIAKKIAGPYADALIKTAQESNSIHSITSDINALDELLKSDPNFKLILLNPIIRNEVKREIIKKAITPQVTFQTSNFLLILIDKGRICYLESIIERYLELVYELANIKIVEVISVVPLNEDQNKQIIAKLQQMTNSNEIVLLTTIDINILGGFIIKIDSKVIDLSIKGQLKKLASHLDSILEI